MGLSEVEQNVIMHYLSGKLSQITLPGRSLPVNSDHPLCFGNIFPFDLRVCISLILLTFVISYRIKGRSNLPFALFFSYFSCLCN